MKRKQKAKKKKKDLNEKKVNKNFESKINIISLNLNYSNNCCLYSPKIKI